MKAVPLLRLSELTECLQAAAATSSPCSLSTAAGGQSEGQAVSWFASTPAFTGVGR